MNTINKNIDTWNLLIKVRDATKSAQIKEKCTLFLNQINTASGNRVKEEANAFLESCNALPVIFETGATSHAVNDLILFTDNTRELAELRDKIYKERIKKRGAISVWDFNNLIVQAINKYIETFPSKEEHAHIYGLNAAQKLEFSQLYVNDFENWKLEHGYK